MHTIQGSRNGLLLAGGRPVGFSKRLALAAEALFEQILVWHDRAAQRRALAELNDLQLKDIGVSRADAARETTKRFWQE